MHMRLGPLVTLTALVGCSGTLPAPPSTAGLAPKRSAAMGTHDPSSNDARLAAQGPPVTQATPTIPTIVKDDATPSAHSREILEHIAATPGDPIGRPDLPQAVAGFPFGATVSQLATLCRSAGSTLRPIKSFRDMYSCNATPQTLDFDLDGALVRTCGGKLCSVTLLTAFDSDPWTIHGRSAQMGSVFDVLRAKYGMPDDGLGTNAEIAGAAEKCARGDDVHVSRIWHLTRDDGQPGANLAMRYSCEHEHGETSDMVLVSYDNDTSVSASREKRQARERNY
jgi:hypothetical protein